ncbi:MAG: hypothetical protein UMV23_01505 [Halanaerobium sp.]|nr:hypothetical protein [Halanaerobium sp.]
MLKTKPSPAESYLHIWTYRKCKVIIPKLTINGQSYALVRFNLGEPEAIAWRDLVQNQTRKCWRCGRTVNAEISLICETCHWFMCSHCGTCEKHGSHKPSPIPRY